MPVNKKTAEFLIRHNDIMKNISNLDNQRNVPRVLPVQKVRSKSTGSLKQSNVPRVLYPPQKVRSKSTGSLQSNVPRVLYPPQKVRSVSTGSLQSNLPRVLYRRPVSMEPVSMGKSSARPQTPYYKEALLSKNIRTDTPHPKKDKTPPVFSLKLQKEQTVKELTNFFEHLNARGGGKYKKKPKRVVKKANKKMI